MRTTTNPDRSTRPLPKPIVMMVVLAMTVVAGAGAPAAAEAIVWLAEEGITQGCNPPTNDRSCPDTPVTRGQMAAFLWRANGQPDGSVAVAVAVAVAAGASRSSTA